MTPRNRRVGTDEPVPGGGTSPRPSTPDVAARPPASRILLAARAVLGAALVLGLSTTVAWTARHHILTSPRFAVSEIVVQGAHHRTAEALEAEAGIAKGMNVFALDLDRARGKLLTDPWVESAVLGRHLPGRVMIQVTEREIGAIVAVPEAYLAARDGRVFKRVEVGDPVDLPIITGLTSDALGQDREGMQRTIVRALDLAGDYEHGPLAPRAPLQEIHVSNGGELTLVVGKDGIDIALGLPPFRRKLEEAVRIFAELERRGAHASVVMLDDEARPDRVVVRTH
jgi:cell division protein FtsQ